MPRSVLLAAGCFGRAGAAQDPRAMSTDKVTSCRCGPNPATSAEAAVIAAVGVNSIAQSLDSPGARTGRSHEAGVAGADPSSTDISRLTAMSLIVRLPSLSTLTTSSAGVPNVREIGLIGPSAGTPSIVAVALSDGFCKPIASVTRRRIGGRCHSLRRRSRTRLRQPLGDRKGTTSSRRQSYLAAVAALGQRVPM